MLKTHIHPATTVVDGWKCKSFGNVVDREQPDDTPGRNVPPRRDI